MLTLLAFLLLFAGSLLVGLALYDAECCRCGKAATDSPAVDWDGRPVCSACHEEEARARGWWSDEIAPGGAERGTRDEHD